MAIASRRIDRLECKVLFKTHILRVNYNQIGSECQWIFTKKLEGNPLSFPAKHRTASRRAFFRRDGAPLGCFLIMRIRNASIFPLAAGRPHAIDRARPER